MIDPLRQEIIASARTIVVKVGTGVVTRPDGSLDSDRIASLVDGVHKILATGRNVVIVSSGAIGAGVGQLGLTKRPNDLSHLQAAAAVGQSYLMRAYDESLRRYEYHAAQILLTAADFEDRVRYLNARNTILTLFDYQRARLRGQGFGAVPIINENDTVSVDEIRFGDNDRLAAMVTNLLRAPLLVMLSVVDGLYAIDPGKKSAGYGKGEKRMAGGRKPEAGGRKMEATRLERKAEENHEDSREGRHYHSPLTTHYSPVEGQELCILSTVNTLDESVFELAGASKSELGTGGMATKLQAARMCTAAGESVLIAGGKRPAVLEDILAGKPVGTLFLPQAGSLASRKRWIGYTVRPRGRYVVDAGARRAVERDGKSLLAIGITDVVGDFDQGDPVLVCDTAGVEFARGLTNYSADDARKIKGLRTSQLRAALHALPYDEVIHRDNLVVTSGEGPETKDERRKTKEDTATA